MRIIRLFKRLLDIGGRTQFVLTLLTSLGLSSAAAGGLIKLLTPEDPADYFIVFGLTMATLSVTFPLSAYALNWALAHVESNRRRALFDDPIAATRTRFEGHLSDGRELYDRVQENTVTTNALLYFRDRIWHWVSETDADVHRRAGYFASQWFVVDDRPDAWLNVSWPQTPGGLRANLSGYLSRLEAVTEALPVTRRQWLRVSLAIDIEAGKKLCEYLRADDSEGRGADALQRWCNGVRRVFREHASEYLHLVDEEPQFSSPAERLSYLQERIGELERVWKTL